MPSIKKIWAKFKGLPKWQKCLFFVFVGAFLVLLIVLKFLLAANEHDENQAGPIEFISQQNKKQEEHVTAEDKKIQARIKEIEEEIVQLDKKQKNIMEKRDEARKKLDEARDFSDITDAIKRSH